MKEKILDKALELFNSMRIDHVTTGLISTQLNISKGNLTYHYPKKEDIVSALYRRMISDMESSVIQIEPEYFSLKDYCMACKKGFEIHLNYRFIALNYYTVVSTNPEIWKHHVESTKKFDQILLLLSENMKADGLMQQSTGTEELEFVNRQIHLTGIFWLQDAQLLYPTYTDDEHVNLYVQITMNPILPYLTEKGKIEFQKIISSLSKN